MKKPKLRDEITCSRSQRQYILELIQMPVYQIRKPHALPFYVILLRKHWHFEALMAETKDRDQPKFPLYFSYCFSSSTVEKTSWLSNLDGFQTILLPFLPSLSRIWIIFSHVQGFNYYLCEMASQIFLSGPNIFTRAYSPTSDHILTTSTGPTNAACHQREGIALTPSDLSIPQPC